MSALSVRLPDSLHKRIKEVARRDNVSINQMITLAVAEKLSALETEDYLGNRASSASKRGELDPAGLLSWSGRAALLGAVTELHVTRRQIARDPIQTQETLPRRS